MSLSPSLSLWSPIKIPFSLYANKKVTPSVPYVDPCNDIKQSNYSKKEAEPARELVSLIVPSHFSKKEETSNLLPHLRVLSTDHKKGTHRKSSSMPETKQIKYVVVPSGAFPDKSNDSEKTFGNGYEKTIPNSRRPRAAFLGDDLYDKCPEFDLEAVCEDCDHVPSIKPWLKKEPDEINLLKHKKTPKMTEVKKQRNKPKENLPQSENTDNNSISLYGKEFQVPLLEDLHKSPAKELKRLTVRMTGKSDANYYERKLAELYAIELGLKI